MKSFVNILKIIAVVIFSIILWNFLYEKPLSVKIGNDNILNDGDLLFVKGTTLRSRIVNFLNTNEKEYSHVGILRIINNTPFIIHSSPNNNFNNNHDVISKQKLNEFFKFNKVTNVTIYRLQSNFINIPTKASLFAESYLNRSVLFDHDFNLDNDNKLYCTELIWCAYKKAGIDLIKNNFDILNTPIVKGRAIFPSTLSNSKYLSEIISIRYK